MQFFYFIYFFNISLVFIELVPADCNLGGKWKSWGTGDCWSAFYRLVINAEMGANDSLQLNLTISVNCEEVRLMLWDTAGQEEFDAITKAYYRGAQAAVLAFSTVDRCSFEAIRSWKKKVTEATTSSLVKLFDRRSVLIGGHKRNYGRFGVEMFQESFQSGGGWMWRNSNGYRPE